jgi:TPR repeat protein
LKTGRGIGQDVPAAIQYFTEGVEQQDPACEYQLAMCFREGSNTNSLENRDLLHVQLDLSVEFF